MAIANKLSKYDPEFKDRTCKHIIEVGNPRHVLVMRYPVMRHSTALRLLALLLCLSLVMTYDLPVAGSIESSPQPNTVVVSTSTKPETNKPVSIVAEDTSKRTETSKEFLRSDGSRLMALYGEPVHYRKDGVWKDIDNTLVNAKNKAGDEVLVNTAGSFGVELPVELSPRKSIVISKNQYALGFILEGTYAAVKGIIPVTDPSLSQGLTDDQKRIASTKLASRLTYSNILPNTDFVYDVASDQLKETIILRSMPDKNASYTYDITTTDLDAVLQKDNSIAFYPKGEKDGDAVFVIPAPFMTDAEGETTYEIGVTLDQTSGCKLTITPSTEWLSDAMRAWPVSIDPRVIANLDRTNIRDQQVDSLKNDVNYNSAYIECGRHATYGIERIYLMYESLPALTSADYIVDANIQIYRQTNTSVVSQMEAHKVNSTWESQTLQWSNRPGYDTTVDDYQLVSSSGWYTWEITDIARGWYAGNNTGMMFKLPDAIENQTSSNNKTFLSSDYGSGYRPILTIAFRNNSGLEDYWNFHNQDVGRAGTGYVNDYTGNLVFSHNDIGFSGNLMPVSISHVYNANDKANNEFGCGFGWRTNFSQKVYQWSADTSYYVWEDEDGTKHYFKYSAANTYLDEDGLFLTLKNNETGNYLFSITDQTGNKRLFDSNGRLRRIQNNQDTSSHIDITYTMSTGNYIYSITDGAGRLYQFAYSGANLVRIEYKGTGSTVLQDIDFAYNGNTELSTLTYFDNRTTSYAYTTNHLLSTATDIDGYHVNYSYNTTSASQPNRVGNIAFHDNSVTGGTLTVAYAQNQTTFTDYQGRTVIEQFNDMGNTTSVQDSQGNAQYARYAKDDDGDSGVANQLKLSSKLQNTVASYLLNGSGEYTDGWTLETSGSPGGSWSYSTTNKYIGTKSVAITRSNEAGTYYRLAQTLTLAKGKTYTLSAWVKTTGMSGTGTGAYLAVENSSNIAKSEIVKTNTSSNDPDTDANGWRRIEATLAIPSNASSSSVKFSLYQGTQGTAYFDGIQAEEATSASRFNLVENGDFLYQNGTSSDALRWSETNLTTSDIRTASSTSPCARLDTNCFQINGDINTLKNINQTSNISGSAGDVFSIGGWAKAESVPMLPDNSRRYALAFQCNYTDSTHDTFWITYNPDSTSWQFASDKTSAAKAYSSIKIYACYYGNLNTASFDGIQVYREEFGTSYTYNSSGEVTSIGAINNSGTANNSTTAIGYTGVDATSVTDADNHSTTATYDGYHNPTSSTSTSLKTATTYSSKGNVTSSKQLDKNNPTGPAIETNTTYTTDENYTSTVTDETRNTTTLSNDTQVGTLQWLESPNDVGTPSSRTAYTYDSIYRASGVSKPVSNLLNGVSQMQAAYTYEDDQIKTISHNTTSSSNDTTYTFNYGDMRLLSSIQVGSGTPRTLVSNSYVSSDRSYNLLRSTYGNGDWVQYSYDSLDRVIGTLFDNDSTNRFAVTYNNAGDVASLTDSANNLFTKYLYDMSDRLKGVTETGINGRNYSHYYSWAFDNNRSVTSFKEILNGSTWTTDYSLDSDNRLSAASYTYGTRSSSTNWTYDAYGRVSAKSISDNGSQIFDTNTTFVAPDSTHTSNLVSTIQNKRHISGGYDSTLTYSYDANGNISGITDGTNPVSYSYDSANQLVRENNAPSGKTWTWVYDAGGNIREKREYSYTLDADLTGKTNTLVNYGYTDSNGWGDLLTSYNGASITYDGLGNPLTDGTWTYTWEGGRNLVGLSKTGTNISYTYNMDGIRTSKTVNGVTTTYTLVGDRVTQESDGTNNIYYRYDNADSLISMNLNGTEYYYIRNVQNDIVGLANASGDVVVQYLYDAWGNFTVLFDSSSNGLSMTNPYRYRGYRNDNETGMYYLQSRYYQPLVGRFINADDSGILDSNKADITDKNGFSYCDNNPVLRADEDGHFWFLIAAAVGAIIGGTISAVSQQLSTGTINWSVVGVNAASGALSGALASTGVGIGLAIAGNAAISAATYAAEQAVQKKKIKGNEMLYSATIGALAGGIGGKGIGTGNLKAVWSVSTAKISGATSARKIAMYSAKKAMIAKTCIGAGAKAVVAASFVNAYGMVRSQALAELGLS